MNENHHKPGLGSWIFKPILLWIWRTRNGYSYSYVKYHIDSGEDMPKRHHYTNREYIQNVFVRESQVTTEKNLFLRRLLLTILSCLV